MRRWMTGIAIAIGFCVVAAVAIPHLTRKKTAVPEERSELVIYTPHPIEMVEYIVREFRQRTGISVAVKYIGTGELREKVKDEGENGKADIIWGGGVESLESAKDLFRPYASSENGAVDPAYKADHGLWYPFSVLTLGILYNKKLVPEEYAPTSWSRLLDPYFKGRIILYNPATSGLSFTALMTMLLAMSKPGYEKYADWDYVKSLISQLNSGSIVSSGTTVYDAIAKGDYFAGIAFENSALSLQKSGADVGFCFPSEGTSSVPDGIALLEGSANPGAAGKFIDFVLGRDVQSMLMQRWQRRSVRIDIEASRRSAAGPRLVPYRISEAASLRESILERWTVENARKSDP